MGHHPLNLQHLGYTRREFLSRAGAGLGLLGLGGLMARANPLVSKAPHFRPRAKRIIHLFMNGGPSHVDTFDPKPALQRFAGKMLPMTNLATERKTGAAFPSPYKFRQYGQGGLPVSEIFPHTARHMDDICVLRSMRADVPNHEPSLMLMNCGESILTRPSMGSWMTYGLGTENQNLPGFIAMCPGYPIQESQNWQCSFLPGAYQGTYVDTRKRKVDELIEHIRNPRMNLAQQRRQLDLLWKINERHARARQNESQLEARIHSFELAYRMQMEATEAFDINREPAHVRKMYGNTTQARQILIARRLVERGVRFVQVWHGNSQPWDNHDDIEVNHRNLARSCDQAIGALLTDLKQRGLLEDTLVMWGGEFGRTPTVELPKPGSNAGKINGRDHNHHGFSMWLAGGGVRGGMAYGATDEFGFKAVENTMHVHDLHATILHLMGFDHEKLTFRHAGRDFRLTDEHGTVVRDIIL
jgi:hypothetical protein